MARGVNKVFLLGHLGQDPELRYTGSGTAVANMRLATNESYTDKNGDRVNKTEWHSIVAWKGLAEVCNEYLEKGSQVYIEGSLQTRSWEDKDGNTRYTTEVKARDVMFLGEKGDSHAGSTDPGEDGRHDPRAHGAEGAAEEPPEQERFEADDSLPF